MALVVESSNTKKRKKKTRGDLIFALPEKNSRLWSNKIPIIGLWHPQRFFDIEISFLVFSYRGQTVMNCCSDEFIKVR